MFYLMYLQSVCTRRSWPQPLYEPFHTSQGYFCKVRVNNREYTTDVPYLSEALAKEGAAMSAYLICRNFSHNDGMYPGQRPGQRSASGAVQGLPVAIGTGRRASRQPSTSFEPPQYEYGSSDGTSSGGNSPRSLDSGFEQQMQQVTQQMPKAAPRRTHRADNNKSLCYCRRGPIRAYDRCSGCLRDSGYA